MKKISTGTYKIESPVKFLEYCAVVGQKEKEGPLGDYFTNYSADEYFGQETFEKAETQMQKEAMDHVIKKSGFTEKDIDFIFAGDLLNQCVSSNYCVRDRSMQFFGLYGACSTMVEAIILSSMVIDGGFARRTIAITSSHFCSAERQFRFPLEYGSQRPPSSQWTVTGAGCVLLGDGIMREEVPFVDKVCPGKVVDMGITDINNMGAAMAGAAVDTLKRYFEDTETTPGDYDLILSGDLGKIGHKIVIELMGKDGYDMTNNYDDCGKLIFDAEKQDTHSGGSGCGCAASVLTGYLLPEMQKKTFKNVLFMATGALMSPILNQQKESIPGIAHLINIKI
ncbi:MAG: stage V sporulation protein AD [Clostridiales bacterium]|nr:stage V sporulation protein AD [Clostridiales bacterium]